MPQTAKVTRENVRAAYEAIIARGEKPTRMAIRAELGGGSYSTINPFVRELLDELEGAAKQPPAFDSDSPMEMPEILAQSINSARLALDAIGQGIISAINTAVTDERRRGRLELDAERDLNQSRLDEVQARRRDAEDEVAQFADEIGRLEAARDDLSERLSVVSAEKERLAQDLSLERDRHRSARNEAERLTAEMNALKQTVLLADDRAKTAEVGRDQAEKTRMAAEKRAEEAERKHQEADVERRRIAQEARNDREKMENTILLLTKERDEAREALIEEKAGTKAIKAELTARIDALVAERGELSARLESSIAEAGQLSERLAAVSRNGVQKRGGKNIR